MPKTQYKPLSAIELAAVKEIQAISVQLIVDGSERLQDTINEVLIADSAANHVRRLRRLISAD